MIFFYDCTVLKEISILRTWKCSIQIEYNRNLQIQGSRYERRRSRCKVDSLTIVKF